ncbi:UDP-N-acetylmuramoyl-L-alanyl-D-glutamate--2,6-diaminopimelate ligase [Blochmannia endosymbiont of Colobopsis nipponica]|uniref:UDP-N-acetylmuramoyl-L-alanyl-D-glutamate--2, 6-diaminopimelate ligase n=1 Tax=Blochmannia endosymbiont of Colobopsis nipponica TaxID=2681987 RepID=UPI00177B13DC|nr:UDP-N-acetylmuramoyl-L-alanyl-D-glutamate--2,6-diaminopimelate ligase [Blochmannia endosymbiont of Colobopsis nipponica]QOI11271.1 UDP-N-acetylmuramoyl-L-alanyl-D-glutamate--2,6-diaminopimelate ligase [Blochmannia endosymbiont of Colobopsis nipponica]
MSCSNLQFLLNPWMTEIPECFFKDIITDSRDVAYNDLFIAIEGYKTNGCFYIFNAINKGASAIIAHCKNSLLSGNVQHLNGVPVVYFNQLQRYLSAISGRFLNHPSQYFNLVGVTGTNGKSTVTHLLSNWVSLLNEKSAVMGTIGNGIIGNIYPSKNTTCSAIEIQKMLAQFKIQGVTFVAIEVSSHGLVEHRVSDLHFKVAVFTNLTRDHLDYHGDMLNYELAKWQLFHDLEVEEFVINYDDSVGRNWLSKIPNAVAVTVSSILPNRYWQGRWLRAAKVYYYYDRTEIFFTSSWGNGVIYTQLLGKFNVSNLLLALATLLVLKYPLSLLLNTAVRLRSICGRMQFLRVAGYPIIVIDYAHTPDALKQALIVARSYTHSKLYCIFGCGGDRDKKKRSLMGKIAERYADKLIITSDNSRNEDPWDIVEEVQKDLLDRAKVQVIISRSEAISIAISQSTSEDLLLIAGKGHENYQIVGNQWLNYSDFSVVKENVGIL